MPTGEMQQKDLVLSANEYAYVKDETKGNVSCWVGPTKTSLSQSDKLVLFNPKTKRFDFCSYSLAINPLVVAPENWYVILKNPTADGRYPTPGTSNNSPDNLLIGKKVNIQGPISFALYPGQMAKVIQGHILRSNEYLVARVYEADIANSSLKPEQKPFINGQTFIIKGTEVSFYIPPTGIEIIRDEKTKNYIREAVTLEKLEYCILKDENGEKRYVHGPEVVFPKSSEIFINNPQTNDVIFKAIELSKISGIYVKVITEYKENDVVHHAGEELFITGADQMIYYPRPEHAIITYGNKIIHYAVAIPAGEGRYVLNRLTGEVKTVKGPIMYLPDPRFEVIVKRKLTKKQCELWYPNNSEVLTYNTELKLENTIPTLANTASTVYDNYFYTQLPNNASVSTVATYNNIGSDISIENNSGFSRNTSFTPPRTITLDTKYDGVVVIEVWAGYAVNVISKDGSRKVVIGPATLMLDYDQVLEEIYFSSGCPKDEAELISGSFLRYVNNRVVDVITVETKEFIQSEIEVTYYVDFDINQQNKWFSINNYVKYLCDTTRAQIRKTVKNHSIEELYQSCAEIVREAINQQEFVNGMKIVDCEARNVISNTEIRRLLSNYQNEVVSQTLKLSSVFTSADLTKRILAAQEEKRQLEFEAETKKIEQDKQRQVAQLEAQGAIEAIKNENIAKGKQAELSLQTLLSKIDNEIAARKQNWNIIEQKNKSKLSEIENLRQQQYTQNLSKLISTISPDLIAALSSKANSDLANTILSAVGPYAIAGENESIADVVTKLLHNTSFEDSLKDILGTAVTGE